jgi:hypothetical protein
MPNPKDDTLESDGRLKRKEYDRELARLHVSSSSSSSYGSCIKA